MGIKKSKKKRRKRRNGFLRIVRFFFEIVFLIALAIVLFLSYKYTRMTIEKPKRGSIRIEKNISDASKSKMEGFITIPVFFVYGDTDSGIMEDIMLIASIEEAFGNVRFAALSTELWLSDEDGYADTITNIYEADGPARLVSLLNSNLGLQMKDYAILRTCIFTETVDRFGGLDITTEDGVQHMNGEEVMTYCRSSYGDATMMDKVSQAAEKLLEYGERQNLSVANHVTDELLYHVTTSVSFFEFCRMVKDLLVYEIKPHADMSASIVDDPQPLMDYLYKRTVVPEKE